MRWWESDKIVHLEITSWVGTIAFGAIHYYGRLCGSNGVSRYERFSVTKKLTKTEARALNRRDSFKCAYLPKETDRLESREEVRRVAKRMWKKLFPKATILLEGSSGVIDPQKVLVAPKEAKERLNDLFDRTELIGWTWNGDPKDKKAMEKIEKEWDAEMEKLVNEKV